MNFSYCQKVHSDRQGNRSLRYKKTHARLSNNRCSSAKALSLDGGGLPAYGGAGGDQGFGWG